MARASHDGEIKRTSKARRGTRAATPRRHRKTSVETRKSPRARQRFRETASFKVV
jgi:hypothetical protein